MGEKWSGDGGWQDEEHNSALVRRTMGWCSCVETHTLSFAKRSLGMGKLDG